jgi:hypothetical protein
MNDMLNDILQRDTQTRSDIARTRSNINGLTRGSVKWES